MPDETNLEGKSSDDVPGPKPPASKEGVQQPEQSHPGFVSNDPNMRGAPISSTGEEAGEPVDLPSEGKLYPPGNPAHEGKVYVRAMTTAEEEILVTERQL